MLCGLGIQQCTNLLHPWCFAAGYATMRNATIQKTTFFELGVYYIYHCGLNVLSSSAV